MGWKEFAVLLAAFLGALGAAVAAILASRRAALTQLQIAVRATRVTAYERALLLCGHLRDWVERTYPIYSEANAPEPELPPVADQVNARAQVVLHGSQEVRAAFTAFDGAARSFWALAMEMRHDGDRRNLWPEIEQQRKAVGASLESLQNSMRADIDLMPFPRSVVSRWRP